MYIIISNILKYISIVYVYYNISYCIFILLYYVRLLYFICCLMPAQYPEYQLRKSNDNIIYVQANFEYMIILHLSNCCQHHIIISCTIYV